MENEKCSICIIWYGSHAKLVTCIRLMTYSMRAMIHDSTVLRMLRQQNGRLHINLFTYSHLQRLIQSTHIFKKQSWCWSTACFLPDIGCSDDEESNWNYLQWSSKMIKGVVTTKKDFPKTTEPGTMQTLKHYKSDMCMYCTVYTTLYFSLWVQQIWPCSQAQPIQLVIGLY